MHVDHWPPAHCLCGLLGLWNSENVFVERLKEFGMTLYDSCDFNHLKHHHCSQTRPNQQKLKSGAEATLYSLVNTSYATDDRVTEIDINMNSFLWNNKGLTLGRIVSIVSSCGFVSAIGFGFFKT